MCEDNFKIKIHDQGGNVNRCLRKMKLSRYQEIGREL